MDGLFTTVILTGLFGLILALLGIFMTVTGRGSFLIAGYNTMPKHKKMLYNPVALSKFIGKYVIIVGVLTVFFAVGLYVCVVNDISTLWVGVSYTAIVVGLAIPLVIYTNTSSRFRN